MRKTKRCKKDAVDMSHLYEQKEGLEEKKKKSKLYQCHRIKLGTN
jgi:hypothetical protein